jgi:hypothetical protein
MECCNKPMSDFSYRPGWTILEERVPHFCCVTCGSRYLAGKYYTADEWFFYINGKTFQSLQRRSTKEEA